MMPDLRSLFDLSRRLLPGKGVKMLGYGDKKTIAGMQATGINGLLTLGRSEKSGHMPAIGTGGQPVALRAGPGVRIHGHGGIHTLERLPEALIEEAALGPARLEWDFEVSAGYAVICTLGESVASPGEWVISQQTVVSTTLAGGWTDTGTASGTVSSFGPGETPPACDEPVYDSTKDPEVDYGDIVSSTYSEETMPFASIIPAAISAVAVDGGTASSNQEWTMESWQAVSEGDIPFSVFFGLVGASVDVSGAAATSARFRLRNAGSCPLRVNCGFYGSGISGGATDLESIINLAPKASSAWQEVPSIDDDPDKYRTAEIRRVRIERWRYVA